MKINEYLKDKFFLIILSILSTAMTSLILIMFKINIVIISYVLLILITSYLFFVLYDYFKRKIFYNNFKNTLTKLDQKYLITEMIDHSNFLDGRIMLEYLSEINKTMHEEINNYKYKSNEFREYLELWCHEIKTPISTSKLIIENNKSKVNQSIQEEIDKIEQYVEQVLFYSKSDIVEKDYIITNVSLKKVTESVIKRNKKDLINKKIKINIEFHDKIVESDSKWLEFILNQIVINSIKYSKEKDALIKITCQENKNNIIFSIWDNGIGINETDLPNVFNKGFTGLNGRKKYKSTGIGLYLCKKLCIKLGHDILINSKEKEYTKITIIFPKSSMLTMII